MTLDRLKAECERALEYAPPKSWTRMMLKLIAVAEATKAMRRECLANGTWYTAAPCEYGEDVDDAISALEATP